MAPTWRTAALGLAAVAGAGGAQGSSPSPLFSRLTEAERQLLLAAAGVSGAENFLLGQTVVGTVVQPNTSIAVVRTSSGDAAQAAALEAPRRDGWRDLYPRSLEREVFRTGLFGTSRVFYPLCKPGVPGNLTVTSFPLGVGPGAAALPNEARPTPRRPTTTNPPATAPSGTPGRSCWAAA